MKMIFSQEEMTSKEAYREACLLPIVNGQMLRKVVSDVSSEIDKLGQNLETIAKLNDDVITTAMKVECYCCGLQEECTQDYILRVKESYSGKWVCGLCSEAVKERSKRAPPQSALLAGSTATAMQEALSSHKSFCVEFNSTTRLNPKLSFTSAMREIAKRSNLSRTRDNNKNPPFPKLARSSSCVPKLA